MAVEIVARGLELSIAATLRHGEDIRQIGRMIS
jgi:hypothetical protein